MAKEIYRITEGFPDGERTVLVYTLRRLAASLCQDAAVATVKGGKKRERLYEACLEQCVAIDAQLELALTINLTTEEETREAARLLQDVYKNIVVRSA